MSEIVEVPKNASETLRVERTEFQGHDLVAVSVWTGRPGDPTAKPTEKGLTLRPETWQLVMPVLADLLAAGPAEGADRD